MWRGNDYKPHEGGIFLTERESYDDSTDIESAVNSDQQENIGGFANKPHEHGIFLAEPEPIDDHANSG